MREIPSAVRSRHSARACAKIAVDDQQGLMRGLVHGVILSMLIWTAAGYLTFILR